jgi:hypothetical protein
VAQTSSVNLIGQNTSTKGTSTVEASQDLLNNSVARDRIEAYGKNSFIASEFFEEIDGANKTEQAPKPINYNNPQTISDLVDRHFPDYRGGEVRLVILDENHHLEAVKNTALATLESSSNVAVVTHDLSAYLLSDEQKESQLTNWNLGMYTNLTNNDITKSLGYTVNTEGAVEIQNDYTPTIVNISGGLWAETNPNSGYKTIFEEIRAKTGNTSITPANVNEHREEVIEFLKNEHPDCYTMFKMYENLGTIAEARGNMIIVQAAGYLASSEERLELTSLVENEGESSPYINVADPNVLKREEKTQAMIPDKYLDGRYADFSIPSYIDGTAVPTENAGHSFAAPTVAGAIANELSRRGVK